MTALAEQEAADSEQRAKLYREQQQKRVQFQTWLFGLRRPDPVAWQKFHARWEPLILWLAERQEPTVEPELDPYYDPLQQREQVNVGT